MSDIAALLRDAGITVVVPTPDEPAGEAWTIELSNSCKRAASRRHMDEIQSPHTSAILVTNVDRNGTSNYIGPNTFGEIAVAFATHVPVYLLQGIPDAYADELLAWGVHPLHGDLATFLAELGSDHHMERAQWQRTILSAYA